MIKKISSSLVIAAAVSAKSIRNSVVPMMSIVRFNFSNSHKTGQNISTPTPTSTQSNSNNQLQNSLSYQINKIDNMLQEQQLQKQADKRQLQLEAKHTQFQNIVDKQYKFPIKLYGTKDKLQQKYSFLPGRIMSYYKIHADTITDHLLKIYKASLYAMVDENAQFMEEYWEKGMMDKIRENIAKAKEKGYRMSVIQDNNFLREMKQQCQILDTVCVRGLSINREDNQHPNKYKKFVEQEQVGLITYTPLYLTENNEKFINPEQNKNVYEGYERMTLRVLLRIRTPLRLQVQEIPVSEEVYTWEHLCIMENQMIAPKHLQSRYKIETLMEWLGKYRFGIWRVVDIDNFMKGNSLFRAHEKQVQIDPIFKGSVFDKQAHVDIRHF